MRPVGVGEDDLALRDLKNGCSHQGVGGQVSLQWDGVHVSQVIQLVNAAGDLEPAQGGAVSAVEAFAQGGHFF